jgi:hypothetical protein
LLVLRPLTAELEPPAFESFAVATSSSLSSSRCPAVDCAVAEQSLAPTL